MNKLLSISFLLLLAIGFSGCVQNVKKQSEEKKEELLLKTFLDKFAVQNPDCLNNDITKEECSKKIMGEFRQTCFGDSIPYITQLPMKFDGMAQYGDEDKYVVQFSCGEYVSDYSLSDDYGFSLQVFSIVNREMASKLKEDGLYHVGGSCHAFADAESFTYPNGDIVEKYPYITTEVMLARADKLCYDLGALVITDLTFTPVKK